MKYITSFLLFLCTLSLPNNSIFADTQAESISQANRIIKGDMTLDYYNLHLKNLSITGDLIIPDSCKNTEFYLENVIIEGKIIAKSDNRNHINLKNTIIKKGIHIGKVAYNLSIETQGDINRINLNSDISISGNNNAQIKITANPIGNFEIENISLKNTKDESIKFTSDFIDISNDRIDISLKIKGLLTVPTGSNIYTIEPYWVDKKTRGVIGASDMGEVLAYTQDGKFLWKTKAGNTLISKISAGDFNNDGKDELLVSSNDGSVYYISNKGKVGWSFKTNAPLNAVCIASDSKGEKFVFLGGIDQHLYKLNKKGELVQKRKMTSGKSPLAIRIIQKDDIFNDGKDYLVVTTTGHISSTSSVLMIDPNDISKNIWSCSCNFTKEKGSYFGRYGFGDVNNDGKNEIILQNGVSNAGYMVVLGSDGKLVAPIKKGKGAYHRGYRMGIGAYVDKSITQKPYILGVFGNQMEIVNDKYNVENVYTSKFSYLDSVVDQKTGNLILGSCHSGGDCIHILDLKSKAGAKLFTAIEARGRILEVIDNLVEVEKQIADFKVPSYQKARNEGFVIDGNSGGDPKLLYPNGSMKFASNFAIPKKAWNWYEVFDKSDMPKYWAERKDGRRTVPVSGEEIIAAAKDFEKRGVEFTIWAGHGTNPFYMSLETAIAVVKAAPTTCALLVYPEIEGIGSQMQYIIKEFFEPLAKACYEQGKTKIFLRNKGMFWSAQVNEPLWNELLTGKYTSAFMPAMEESNSRVQEASVAGRVGVWYSTTLENWASRQIEDNAIYNRQFQWAMQQVQSHYIRALVYETSNGAKVFQNGMGADENYCTLVYKMIDNHILLSGEKDDMLSVSDLAVAFKDTPNEEFLHFSTNGNYNTRYTEDETKETYVFDRISNYWAGYETLEHDFSRYGHGVTHRRLNYLPENPYGLVAHISANFDIKGSKFKDKVVTDGKYWYDENGKQYSAQDYKNVVVKKLEDAKLRLPLTVKGANWTARKIDDTHIRLTLIDSGYITPKERLATITLQNIKGVKATNILTNQEYKIEDSKLQVTVPAGIFSIVDIEIE